MKTINTFFLFLLILSGLNFGWKPDPKELICSGKWYLEYIEMDGDKFTLSLEERKSNWVVFHENNTHEFMEEGTIFKGKWTYIPESHSIKSNDKDGVVEQKIIQITDEVLVVSVLEQGTIMLMGMRK